MDAVRDVRKLITQRKFVDVRKFVNFLYVVLMVMLPGVALGQDLFFEFGKDTTIILQQNVKLVRMLEDNIKHLKSMDGKKVSNIQIAIDLKKGKKYLFSHNYLTQYQFDSKTDKVTASNDRVLNCEVNFITKRVTKSYKNDSKLDHYKPEDLEKKIKDKEKSKKP